MSELIVYKGNSNISLTPSRDNCYLYLIGSGRVTGGSFLHINDASRLNRLAEDIQDDYSTFIYSLNANFLKNHLTLKDLSLFFFTDLSCKRSEFFDTYDSICNLLLIQETLKRVDLEKVQLIGVDIGFTRAIKSLFPRAEFISSRVSASRANHWRRLGADALYFCRLCGATIVNKLDRQNDSSGCNKVETVFYSVYPQMFSESGRDTKYGSFFEQSDRFAVSIITDGMHQATSIVDYCRFRRKAITAGLLLIDGFLEFRDCLTGLYWVLRTRWFFLSTRKQSMLFRDIDISEFIKVELLYSLSRISRLCAVMGTFRRFLTELAPKKIVYYPVEYPFGRMISYIANSVNPNIVRTGFQMSITSKRRSEQFLARNEASQTAPFLYHAPIPDRILAEDETAASIYRHSGYKNVEIMRQVYRYEYLKTIVPEKHKGWVLVAPGLHDGELMLEVLMLEIQENPGNTYFLKPHPRADNTYIDRYLKVPNICIANKPVYELLTVVAEVFVTYSSVGLEAERLGLPVTIININGRINASPMFDRVETLDRCTTNQV